MRRWVILALALSLGGCVSYHREATVQRMARPKGLEPTTVGEVAPDPSYPSVGGDVLKGTSVQTEAPDDAIVGEPTPPQADPVGPVSKRRIAHSLEPAPS